MHIGINLVAFLPGSMGGIETYCRNLLAALQEVDAANLYTVLSDYHYKNEIPLKKSNFNIHECNFSKPSFWWLIRGIIRNSVNLDILTPFINRLKVDVIHHPFSYLNPLKTRIPSVLTFHDMQHEFYPGYFSPYEMKIRKQLYRPSPALATRVIAISAFAKSCLVERYGINPDKIDVIYNGHNPAFKVIEDPAGLEGFRLKYNLDRPYLYYPAASWPHKNHGTLLAAIKLLREKHGFDGQLILSGVAKQDHGKILENISRHGLENTVRILGYLPDDDLPYLYNLARLMVFPSLFEGFGLPLLEAMSCGCPIVCSNAAAIPEIAGDAGVFFEPASAEDIAEKIVLLWDDGPKRTALRAKGIERAKLKVFSWENTAHETITVYRKAAGHQ